MQSIAVDIMKKMAQEDEAASNFQTFPSLKKANYIFSGSGAIRGANSTTQFDGRVLLVASKSNT
jgi:hypothetical protein